MYIIELWRHSDVSLVENTQKCRKYVEDKVFEDADYYSLFIHISKTIASEVSSLKSCIGSRKNQYLSQDYKTVLSARTQHILIL